MAGKQRESETMGVMIVGFSPVPDRSLPSIRGDTKSVEVSQSFGVKVNIGLLNLFYSSNPLKSQLDMGNS